MDVADDRVLGGLLLEAVLVVVEGRLQGEPPVSGLAAAATLGDVRVVAPHRARLVGL